MKARVLEVKTFKVLDPGSEAACFLNAGDIFLPNGTGWEYKVLYKVMHMRAAQVYYIDVFVKKV